MRNGWHRRLGDRVVRRPRLREHEPVRLKAPGRRRRLVLPASTSVLLSLTIGFAALISIGTALLALPVASVPDGGAPFITALFTATSAVCVTGLVVVDSATYWSAFGQSVLLALMFLGGLGIMSAGVVALVALGRRITLSERVVLRETVGANSLGEVTRIGRNVALFAIGLQLVGFLVIFLRFLWVFPLGEAARQGLFLTVSAFNNAGFNILPGSASLAGHQRDAFLLAVVAGLIVLGSISLPVVRDVALRRRRSRWSLDTQLVVLGTLGLWLFGGLMMLLFELRNPDTLGGLPVFDQVTNAGFQAIASRTAGFSTIDFGATRPGTDFLFMLLMFVGGAAGSTAGGIKVNTMMVLLVASIASIRGRSRPEAFRRELPYAQVARAAAVVLLAMLALLAIVIALGVTELNNIERGRFGFLDLLFEAVSAFGTVGLSRGITSALTDPGQVIVALAMYVGRLGPLTIALGLALRERRAIYRYAQERVRIG